MKSPYTWDDIRRIRQHPHLLGHLCGKNKLTEIHSDWMHWGLDHKEKRGLLAHRGSYKSTCLTEVGVLYCWMQDPEQTIAIVRKSYTMAADMIRSVMNMAESPPIYYLLLHCWYADADNKIPDKCVKPLFNIRKEGSLNLACRKNYTKEPSLMGMGINGNFTGMHVDRLLMDDVTSYNDRLYDPERAFTIMMVNELLSNILNRNKPATLIGTPWHRDDALMMAERESGVPFKRYPYQVTGILSEEQIEEARRTQTGALFDCNYNLVFTSSADMIFFDPHMGLWEVDKAKKVVAHIDASFGGEDKTALTIAFRLPNEKINMVGFLYEGHIQTNLMNIFDKLCKYGARELYMECNADQGFTLQKILEHPAAKSYGLWGHEYRETMKKDKKIETYLYDRWNHIQWSTDTDEAYMNQILDWTSNSRAHDDAPDSAASLIREAKYATIKDIMALYR